MPALDFTEIPSARASRETPGEQDTFELFAREVLVHIGFKIVSPPNRGADQGKDMIIEESRRGVGGETTIRWLVSCKHFAPMGRSVSADDELNILERVYMHKCSGFLGFYSTVSSSGLGSMLDGLTQIQTQIYDRERIERSLLGSSIGITIAKRFFPKSVKLWESDPKRAADVMVQCDSLFCQYTGENLLVPEARGIIALVRPLIKDSEHIHYEDIYWCLKGQPDRILQEHYWKQGLTTEWEDIPDVLIPTIYLKWCMSGLNQLRSGITYSDKAFEKLKQFMIAVFPYVSRDLHEPERKRIKSLIRVPSWIGGLG